MNADTLHRAATLMRDRATDALKYSGRDLWTDMSTVDPDNDGWIVCERRQPDVDWDTTVAVLPYDYQGHVARHVAGMHPVVALAVADWLDLVANWGGPEDVRRWGHSDSADFAALSVSRAYLGEDA